MNKTKAISSWGRGTGGADMEKMAVRKSTPHWLREQQPFLVPVCTHRASTSRGDVGFRSPVPGQGQGTEQAPARCTADERTV